MGSVDVNPPNADIHITNHGSDWLWAVFAIMTVSMMGMFVWSHMRPRGTRFFHNIALIVLTVSTIAYFSMASDLGATPITTEFRATGTRQIWYVRYIQWFINFPLLLVLILTATGLALTDILTIAFWAWVVVVCGLVGALVRSSYKWGYYVFGLVAFVYIWIAILGFGPHTTSNAGDGMRSGYIQGSGFVVLITLLYPIAWACSEGANVISPTSEMVWYGILDLLLGPFFLFFFVFGIRNIEYDSFGLQSWKYSDTAATAATTSATPAATFAPAANGSGPTTATAPNITQAAPASDTCSTSPGTSTETAASGPTTTSV
ncbi:uncharacterized protein PHACADRAFT_187203 [Phanerochaete carnosa HHB-10118-sp]|uniref:Heat shock protein 30 n=1 Tax=Phanerochaete carnosa (strain HHB-10118-sp) TaxID=650164 RepID=K5VYZ4_PHACS|nr:uncharacterized protein PHACADRAFT_187203 [Phanerochaete carnosa HHB-10118-sp]EKM51799.1 hypothetical protein PHACADRAFT_187203 [Phanerochaete carnosa HHB-10118-sp]